MICGTFTRTKIQAADLQLVIDLFKANDPPPTKVESKQEADGTYTVVATWPACPDETTHSASGA